MSCGGCKVMGTIDLEHYSQTLCQLRYTSKECLFFWNDKGFKYIMLSISFSSVQFKVM